MAYIFPGYHPGKQVHRSAQYRNHFFECLKPQQREVLELVQYSEERYVRSESKCLPSNKLMFVNFDGRGLYTVVSYNRLKNIIYPII